MKVKVLVAFNKNGNFEDSVVATGDTSIDKFEKEIKKFVQKNCAKSKDWEEEDWDDFIDDLVYNEPGGVDLVDLKIQYFPSKVI